MDRKVKSFRLRVDLLEWVESYASGRSTTQIAVIESALESFRGLTRGGVPDLPVAAVEVAKPAAKPKASSHASPAFADAKGSRQQRLNAAMLRARAK